MTSFADETVWVNAHCKQKSNSWRRFHEAAKRMFVFAGQVPQFLRLRVRDSERIGPALRNPMIMGVQHDLRRCLAVLVEYPFQHMHNELHRGEVVIEKQH